MTASEVVELTDDVVPTVEFRGRRFAVRDHMSLLPLMKFATIAKRQQAQTDRGEVGDPAVDGPREMEALAALYELLEQCITETDFGAFYDHALAVGAGQEELMRLVRDAIGVSAGRPTQPPSASPGGRSPTGQSSAAGSSSPASSPPVRQGDPRVQADLEARGRPDLALVVRRADEARAASTTSWPA